MLLMVEKRIRGVISQFIYRYTEDNNKQIKDYDKSKESPYLQYGMERIYTVAQYCKSFQ